MLQRRRKERKEKKKLINIHMKTMSKKIHFWKGDWERGKRGGERKKGVDKER